MLVRHLGLKPYAEVLDLQQSLARQRARGAAPDTLLLAQHPPIYTRGQSGRAPARRLPFPLRAAARAGGLFYHGPGQLCGYPVFHLDERGLDLRDYIESLEGVLIEALLALGVKTTRRSKHDGLWSAGRRLVFISAGTMGLISSHGFHININCDLGPLRLITKRGEPAWTSLAEILGRPQDETAAARSVAEAFLRYF